ncbi:hypothetical protein [Butyrivibrio sp. MC2021]|uniref:hypothetical protein n=1 Tax=Butyrivibrio sp. MC2021 TaxID=1408306 RepID=UPI00047C8A72|nr:hypothetical protein [Butyrivibrio sp. MC2021]
MSIEWGVLGIEPTKDKDVITKAYRSELKKTNPEDDPEGFKRLRAAYEQAQKFAQESDDSSGEKTPLDQWRAQLEDIYNDFTKRKDPKCWRKLFDEPIVTNLDTRPQAQECLFTFLMDSFNLSKEVWNLIGDEFDVIARKEELYNEWHKDFIDFVIIGGMQGEEGLPLELFTPGTDGFKCDRYRELFYRAVKRERENKQQEALALLDEIEELPEKHPYGEALKARLTVSSNGDSMDTLLALYKKMPEDAYIIQNFYRGLLTLERFEECEKYCREAIEKSPDQVDLYLFLVDALMGQGKKRDTTEVFRKAMRVKMANSERIVIAYNRAKVCDQIIADDNIKVVNEDPKFNEEMAWCCITGTTQAPDKARIYFDRIKKGGIPDFDYDNLAVAIATLEDDTDKVLEYTDRLINSRDQLTSKEDIENYDYRLSSWYVSRMNAYSKKGDIDAAMDIMDLVLEKFGDERTMLISCASASLSMEKFEMAKKIAQRLIDGDQLEIDGWYFMAQACEGLKDDAGELAAAERLINLGETAAEGVLHQIKVLSRNGAGDQMDGLFYSSVNAFRRAGRASQAEELVLKVYDFLNLDIGDSDLFQIYAQFGQWDKAREFLKNRNEKYFLDTKTKEILLELYQGNIKKAKGLYLKFNLIHHVFKDREIDDYFMRIKGDLKGQLRLHEKKFKEAQKKDYWLFYRANHLAFICSLMKNYEKAKEYATILLEENKEHVKADPESATLYSSMDIIGYAALGDFAKARQQIEEVRKMPLCENCYYGECKDSYIYEMYVEVLEGNYEKAHELAKMGMERWPDDVDFVTMEYEMRSMGV